MINLTIFEAFLITHLVIDWIFQTKWESSNKATQTLPLIIHCFIYTAGFIPAFLFFKINLLWLLFIFVSHIVIDRRNLVTWLLEDFRGFKKEKTPELLYLILWVGVDQTLHLLVLALIVILM